MSPNRCFSASPPHIDISRLSGKLVVLEGPDSSGRSTQIGLLSKWLEEKGHAVVRVGIKRSALVAQDLEKAKNLNVMSPRTMSLFYATDFYDQMENVMVPALRSGAIVLADRYVFTLMTRDLVRGADPGWLDSLYSRAMVPDKVLYLKVPVENLVVRALKSNQELDYWESGMDMGLTRDWFDCFMAYQTRIRSLFADLSERFGFDVIDADQPQESTQKQIQKRMEQILNAR